jgi:tetratricopeptide (TPR) repeat protein
MDKIKKVGIIILILTLILISNFAFTENVYFKSDKEIDSRTAELTTSEEKRQFSSMYEVNGWMTHYYQNPNNSKRLIPALEFLLREEDWELQEPAKRANPIIHFFATAFQEDKDKLDKLRVVLDKSDRFQKKILNRIIYETENYRVIEPVDAESFDLVWAEFFATGKVSPILRLINVLEWEIDNDDLDRYADLTVLTRSLSSNIEQHLRVRLICEQELENRSGLAKQRLYGVFNYPSEEAWRKHLKVMKKIADRNKNENIFRTIVRFFTTVRSPTKFRYYNKGVEYAIQGRFKEAEKEFVKALELDPFYTSAKLSLQVIEDAIGQKIKKDTTIHLFRATSYLNKGMFNEAILESSNAILNDPNYGEAYHARGSFYLYLGKFDLALSDFNKAIGINPWNAKTYCNRGNVYFAQRLYDQALSDYGAAILIDPQLAEAYSSRGGAYVHKGQYDLAISDYNKAIEINSKYGDAYYNRGLAYANKEQYDLAISDFNRVIKINPQDAGAYSKKALFCEKAGRAKEAINAYKKFIRYVQPESINDIAYARERLRELENAQTRHENIFQFLEDKFRGKAGSMFGKPKVDIPVDIQMVPLPGFIPNQQDDSRTILFNTPYGMVEDEAVARNMGIYRFYKSADGKKIHQKSVISISFSKKKDTTFDLQSFIVSNTMNMKKFFPGQEVTVGLLELPKDVVKKFEDMAIPYQAILFFIDEGVNQQGHNCAIFFFETPDGFWSINWTAPKKILEREGRERDIFLRLIKSMMIGVYRPDMKTYEIHM